MKKEAYERNVQSDLIRVIAMLFVISVHIPINNLNNGFSILPITQAAFFTCNGMFYMLSGKFNLRMNKEGDYKSYYLFYIKKIAGICIPYFVYCILLWGVYNGKNILEMTLHDTIKSFADMIFVTNENGHLWFMYPLVGMLLGAPFLSRLLHSLTDIELKILVFVGLFWEFFTVIFLRDMGQYEVVFKGWFLNEWIFYFILGYCCDRLIKKNQEFLFILIGGIALVITILQLYIMPERSYNIHDISPVFTCVTVGMYVLLDRKLIIHNSRFKKIISFVAKYSFGVYIVHMAVMGYISSYLENMPAIPVWFLKLGITFGISFLIAFIADNLLINRIKKLFLKLFYK